jgi:hypothetical protein
MSFTINCIKNQSRNLEDFNNANSHKVVKLIGDINENIKSVTSSINCICTAKI